MLYITFEIVIVKSNSFNDVVYLWKNTLIMY